MSDPLIIGKETMAFSEDIQIQLQKALAECAALREENDRLKKLLSLPSDGIPPMPKPTIAEPSIAYSSPAHQVSNTSSIKNKIALFRSLFRGREDLYPVRWEGKQGNSGYSPACANEWNRGLCAKLKVKCADCENRKFLPVTDDVITLVAKEVWKKPIKW